MHSGPCAEEAASSTSTGASSSSLRLSGLRCGRTLTGRSRVLSVNRCLGRRGPEEDRAAPARRRGAPRRTMAEMTVEAAFG